MSNEWPPHVELAAALRLPWHEDNYASGAAAVFGLLGMALAIRETYLCPNCGSWEGQVSAPRYGGPCQCENDD